MVAETKICGLTRPEDAAVSVAAGARYLGVVYAGGPRRIDDAAARAVVAAAEDVPVLGVFGTQSVAEILRIAARVGLSGAQLHGRYREVAAAELRRAGLLVWRVARVGSIEELDDVAALACEADALLVEPRVPHALGGAGVPLALALGIEARRRLTGIRLVLAGGLTPETVGEAVALVRPDVVDVSSGVESRPGIKDPFRIAQFLEAVVGHHADP